MNRAGRKRLLDRCHKIARVIETIDSFLRDNHADYFGDEPCHPFLTVKSEKVIHDNVWGTNSFSWAELIVIDSPILQRLRRIHQTGLAYHVYPSAHHTRFEHTLGVVVVASKVFDSIVIKQRPRLLDLAKSVYGTERGEDSDIADWRSDLRMAALLHDTGHSLFSHTSELVYENITTLKSAVFELENLTGKASGAGEVLSFCIALSESLWALLERQSQSNPKHRVPDLLNSALMIVGRSLHPGTQFLGDIISSGLDADKLDYLRRDAQAAGIPLQYDLDRFLYVTDVVERDLADGQGQLKALYEIASTTQPQRKEILLDDLAEPVSFQGYGSLRLTIPAKGLNAIEQIVLSKLMLFAYIYHHPKVRAAEGLLARLLRRTLRRWQEQGKSDEEILRRFLEMSDHSISTLAFQEAEGRTVESDYVYRLENRLIPRWVLQISGTLSGAANDGSGEPLKTFLADLSDMKRKHMSIPAIEEEIGTRLLEKVPGLASNARDALANAGVWIDAPKPASFRDAAELLIPEAGKERRDIAFSSLFPINRWTEAYSAYKYCVRVFAFSEHWKAVQEVACDVFSERGILASDTVRVWAQRKR